MCFLKDGKGTELLSWVLRDEDTNCGGQLNDIQSEGVKFS